MNNINEYLENLENLIPNIIENIKKIDFTDKEKVDALLFNLKETLEIMPQAKDNLKLIYRLVNSELYLLFMLIQNIFLYLPANKDSNVNNFFNNYTSFAKVYRELKKKLLESYQPVVELKVDPHSSLWDTKNMKHIKVNSDFSFLRRVSKILTKKLTELFQPEKEVLTQQICELIKNGMKHGNKLNKKKKVSIWYQAAPKFYKIIVEDEGEGFKNLEDWNEFNKKRNEAILNQDMEAMFQYIAYRTEKSDESDGGNALFAALEYWDSGLIYNEKRNKVVAIKYFY